jgi:SAM-dependent methyltransferase
MRSTPAAEPETPPRMYSDLADWWPLISSPAEYAEEAADLGPWLAETAEGEVRTVLELGSGGGNLASHLKRRFTMTLVDRSPEMLAVSRRLNPELEHLEGDMRTVLLGRTFDGVLVHDAIMSATTEAELFATFATAATHCRPGGVAVFVPDEVTETFVAGAHHAGNDDGARGVRYLEWSWDPDPRDTTFVTDYAFVLREADGATRVVHDRHTLGLFPRARWLELLGEAGFAAHAVTDSWRRDVFVCRRLAEGV